MSGATDPATVLALRRRFWANGYRPLEVWGPDQLVDDKGEPLNKPGKQPRGRWIERQSKTRQGRLASNRTFGPSTPEFCAAKS
jgi:hypothetical protein